MMNCAERTQERLKEILNSGAHKPSNIEAIIRSDIISVLRSYMVLGSRGVDVKIEPGDNGYEVSIKAFADNLKAMNYLR